MHATRAYSRVELDLHTFLNFDTRWINVVRFGLRSHFPLGKAIFLTCSKKEFEADGYSESPLSITDAKQVVK
jgi:hypothetical protein